jgi:hypothetical protein
MQEILVERADAILSEGAVRFVIRFNLSNPNIAPRFDGDVV